MVYIFDGSYEGLLCAVFTAFERKEFQVNVMMSGNYQDNLFECPIYIQSDANKAQRILVALKKILDPHTVTDFWRAFLSEDPPIYSIIFRILVSLFKGQKVILQNYGNEDVLYFHQTLKKVSRERHRVKAFVRFQKSEDGLYTAIIEPDFNVLPLVVQFFRNRYADQKWLIYDSKRHYGLYYDLQQVNEVVLTKEEGHALQKQNEHINLDMNDQRYERMWKSYFESTNIEARKNLKLHVRHVPRRYWKYLPEKQSKA